MNSWLKLRVVARAWPTWVTAAALVASVAADELTKVVGADSPVVVLLLRVAAWLGAAVAIIRRSTPVLDDARGLLPTGQPVTSSERYLGNELAYMRGVLKEGG